MRASHSTGVTTSKRYDTAGSYVVTLTVTDDAFQQSTVSQTINVVATPSAGTGLAGTGHELWNLQVAAVPI